MKWKHGCKKRDVQDVRTLDRALKRRCGNKLGGGREVWGVLFQLEMTKMESYKHLLHYSRLWLKATESGRRVQTQTPRSVRRRAEFHLRRRVANTQTISCLWLSECHEANKRRAPYIQLYGSTSISENLNIKLHTHICTGPRFTMHSSPIQQLVVKTCGRDGHEVSKCLILWNKRNCLCIQEFCLIYRWVTAAKMEIQKFYQDRALTVKNQYVLEISQVYFTVARVPCKILVKNDPQWWILCSWRHLAIKLRSTIRQRAKQLSQSIKMGEEGEKEKK